MKNTTVKWTSLGPVPSGILWWNMPLTDAFFCRTMKLEPLMEDSCFLQETCIRAFSTCLLPQPSLNSPYTCMIVCPQNTYLQKSWKAVLRPLCLGFCVLDYYQGIRGVLVGDKRLPPWAGLVQHCSFSSGTHCWRDGPCTSKVSGKLPPWLQLGSSSFLRTPEDKENTTHKKRNQPRRAFPR